MLSIMVRPNAILKFRYFKNLGVSYLSGKKVANTLHRFKIFLFDLYFSWIFMRKVNPLSANPAKWLKRTQTIRKSNLIVQMCLTILWGWRLKG